MENCSDKLFPQAQAGPLKQAFALLIIEVRDPQNLHSFNYIYYTNSIWNQLNEDL